jgi:hypothetical protein
MKRGTLDHGKTHRLAKQLENLARCRDKRVARWIARHTPHHFLHEARSILESLFQCSAQYTPAGNIGRYDDTWIAAKVDWDGKPEELVAALVDSGWLDTHPDHHLIVHDWHEHCEESVRRRLQRNGQAFAVPPLVPDLAKFVPDLASAAKTRTRTCPTPLEESTTSQESDGTLSPLPSHSHMPSRKSLRRQEEYSSWEVETGEREESEFVKASGNGSQGSKPLLPAPKKASAPEKAVAVREPERDAAWEAWLLIMDKCGRPVSVRRHAECRSLFFQYPLGTQQRIVEDAGIRSRTTWNAAQWTTDPLVYLKSEVWDTEPIKPRGFAAVGTNKQQERHETYRRLIDRARRRDAEKAQWA